MQRWRERYGGPGTRIPDELWDDAVEIARVEGVHETARALRLDAGRLERRLVATMRQAGKVGGGSNQFVELAAFEVSAIGQSAIELVGSGGERMRIEVVGSAAQWAFTERMAHQGGKPIIGLAHIGGLSIQPYVKADGLCPHFTEIKCPLFVDKMSAAA